MGKHVEWVGDAPGLVLGRIVAQIVNEAHFAVGEGVADRRGRRHRHAARLQLAARPVRVGEAIGPARVVSVLDALRSELGEERYRVAPLLRRAARESDPSTASHEPARISASPAIVATVICSSSSTAP